MLLRLHFQSDYSSYAVRILISPPRFRKALHLTLQLPPLVRRHASVLLLPGSIAPAPHLTFPLCCHKAQRRAVRGAELSFIVSILSTAVFSCCVHLITANEFALYNTCYLPYAPYMNPRLDKAFFLHVLILIIEAHVQTQGFYVRRFCR